MYKTLLLLTALALVQARPSEDTVVTNVKLYEVYKAGPVRSSNADDCETLDNGCPVDYTIHQIIPHEQDCRLFYLCDKGERVMMPCPVPLYFDPVTMRCDWSRPTGCVNDYSTTDPPTTEPEATTIAAGSAAGISDIGEVLENGCPADIHIHHLLPHEECEKFYQCNFGEKVERDCAPGTVFHFEIQVCDWPRNVPRCAGSSGATARPPTTPDSEDGPTTNDPTDWETLPNGCPVNSNITHLLPHESECDKYYVCDNGVLVEMKCPTATHFSPSQQKCTWPHEAGCEHWTGGCSNPGGGNGSCGGSTATPDNSTTPVSDITTTPEELTTTTTESPCDTEVPVIDSTTTAGPTDGVEETTEPPCDTEVTVIDSTTTAGTTDGVEETTDPTLGPNPEDETTTNSTIPDSDISTTPPTDYTEDSTITEALTDSTTDEITTEPSTEGPDLTTTEALPCDTEGSTDDPGLPGNGTTAGPCPICPTVPVTPEEKCKQGCNVAPWAHEECDKYYSCIGDEFRLNICAEGLHFNPSTLTCDFICNAGCVRNVPQVTRHPDGLLMFVPNILNSRMNMMELIEHELNGDL